MSILNKVFLGLFFITNVVCSQTFVPTNDGVFTTLIVSASDVGDYDNDGDIDIITMGGGWGDPNIYTIIYNNDGLGNFTQSSLSLSENFRNGQVQFIDYDNDSDLDIFISGLNDSNNSSTKLYENVSNNFLEVPFVFSDDSIINNQFAWGDLDMDGDLDLILQGNVDTFFDFTYLYRNDGNNQFALINQSIVGYSQGKILIRDLDNDGYNDIICSGLRSYDMIYNTADSRFYRNNGDFTFTEMLIVEGIMNGDAELRDCNNDGLLDYLMNGQNGFGGTSNNAKLYLNNNNFNFVEYTDTFFPNDGSASNFVSADYTGNGELDFLISSSGVYFYTNEGNLNLTQVTSSGINETYLDDIDVGDFDNDGDIDVFLIKANSSKIYSNQSSIQNSPPNPPSNLISNVIGSDVSLNWDFSLDNESPLEQQTYNLYVGTSSGNTDIITPMADLNTGYRKIVQIGNMQYKNEALLKDLPDGTYYWSVQAIDNQYSGSAFAPEQTFVIGNLSVNDNALNNSMNIYPNPVFDKLNIDSNIEFKELSIYDITGKEVVNLKVNTLAYQLDISNLINGLYFLKIQTTKGEEAFKIIKK